VGREGGFRREGYDFGERTARSVIGADRAPRGLEVSSRVSPPPRGGFTLRRLSAIRETRSRRKSGALAAERSLSLPPISPYVGIPDLGALKRNAARTRARGAAQKKEAHDAAGNWFRSLSHRL